MLKSIKLKNYRNLDHVEIQLNAKSTLIIAPNSSGKTNFLESIYFSIYGSPFKTVETISEIIGPSGEFAKVEANWEDSAIEIVVSKVDGKLTKNYFLNSKSTNLKRISAQHSALVFAPNSVDLISGDPSLRRQDLDYFLSSISKTYYSDFLTYNKLLKNRNALLKAIRANSYKRKELDFWTDKLIEKAESIFKFRQEFFLEIDPFIRLTANEMEILLRDNEFKDIEFKYLPNIHTEKLEDFSLLLRNKLEANVEKEIIVGKTLYGIHKDEYGIFLKEKNMRFFGSRGQQRLSTFLIKLAQIKYYEKNLARKPLFLIDDLMSELDSSNRERVAKYLTSKDIQFVLTSAEWLEIPNCLKEESTIIHLGK